MLNLIEKYNKLAEEKELIEIANESIESIETILRIVKDKELQNEQWVLDYLDTINELSVTY